MLDRFLKGRKRFLSFHEHVIYMVIVRSKDIKGGKPVVKGSRVTVEAVVERFYGADMSISEISDYLNISKDSVEEALRFHNKEFSRRVEA